MAVTLDNIFIVCVINLAVLLSLWVGMKLMIDMDRNMKKILQRLGVSNKKRPRRKR